MVVCSVLTAFAAARLSNETAVSERELIYVALRADAHRA